MIDTKLNHGNMSASFEETELKTFRNLLWMTTNKKH